MVFLDSSCPAKSLAAAEIASRSFRGELRSVTVCFGTCLNVRSWRKSDFGNPLNRLDYCRMEGCF